MAAPDLSDSFDRLHRAGEEVRREANRLAESLIRRRRELNSSLAAPQSPPPAEATRPEPPPVEATRPGPPPERSQPLLPQLVAACVPLAALALVEVHWALAAAVAVAGAVLLQVRWWMLAVATLTLSVVLMLGPGLGGGDKNDRVAALLALFCLMTAALVIQELWERSRKRAEPRGPARSEAD